MADVYLLAGSVWWRAAAVLMLAVVGCDDAEDSRSGIVGPTTLIEAPDSILGATLTIYPDELLDANCGFTSDDLVTNVTTFIDSRTVRTRNLDGTFDDTSTDVQWSYSKSGRSADINIQYVHGASTSIGLVFHDRTSGDVEQLSRDGFGCRAFSRGEFTISGVRE